MSITNRKWFPVALVVCFGLLVFAVSFYLLFPYDKLVAAALVRAERETALQIDVAQVRPALSPGTLLLDRVQISAPASRGGCTILSVPRLKLGMGLLSPFSSEKRLRYSAGIFDGTVQGNVRAGSGNRMSLSFAADGLNLGRWTPDPKCAPISVDGLLNGTLEYAWNQNRPHLGEGTAKATLTSGKVGGLKPLLMMLDAVQVDRLVFSAGIQGGKLTLDELTLAAKELDAEVTGLVFLAVPLQNSRLNLRIKAEMKEEARKRQGVPFKEMELEVHGTLERPRARLVPRPAR